MLEKIYVYSLEDLKLKHVITTLLNVKGLCSLNSATGTAILACPDVNIGKVLIKLCLEETSRVLECYDTDLGCLELNSEGTLLAVASDKGTLIRIYTTDTHEFIHQLRRGIDKAVIHSIAFHPTSKWVICSSDKGTIHIFSTSPNVLNPKSNLSFMKKVLPKYFESELSYSQFHIKKTKTICCFGKDNSTAILVTTDGTYYAVNYSDPGESKELFRCRLLDL